jgi:alanine racemase
MANDLKRTWTEIDLDHLLYNYHALRRRVGEGVKFLAVVKADAYGHGAVQVAKTLQEAGADYLAVSSLDEARELRNHAIETPILILGHTPPEQVGELIRLRITQTVSALAKAEEYSAAAVAAGGTLKIHIKLDTGMSRLGFLCAGEHFEGGAERIARSCALPGLEAEGIFTHFAVSDEPGAENESFTRQQFALFCRMVETLRGMGCTFAIRHCANSGAVAYYPEMWLDMVRPGILLYGLSTMAEELGLKPVMRLMTCVSTIKTYDPGATISYGRLYQTTARTRVGVLPIGYADGLFRSFSNRLQLVTEDGAVPILGRICMDMCMVDLTHCPHVNVGSPIEIFGQRNSVNDLAAMAGTIPYEIVCAVSKRVPRLYFKGGKCVERKLWIVE